MITVITPTRNRLGFLRDAVGSVLAQSFRDWELIVVDDCSQDGTWDWLQSLDNGRIRALRMEQHRERSAARNVGLAAARGEYVLFLDDDDWLLDGALARLSAALQARSAAIAAVGARVRASSGGWNRTPHPRRSHFRSTWTDALSGWAPGNGQTLLKLRAVRQVGGWNERLSLAEDTDLWLRVARLGPVVLIPQAVLGYRAHAGQTAVAGATTLAVTLRRARLEGLDPRERARADRTLLAMRHKRVASRAFRRGRYPVACLHCWLAVRQAPWLLTSPISRPEITGLAMKSLTGLALGERVIRYLRHLRRAVAAALPRQPATPTSMQTGPGIERTEAS